MTNEKSVQNETLIKTVQELNEAIATLRKKDQENTGESKAVVEKIQNALDNYEVKNQELLRKNQEQANQIKDIEEKLISITSAGNYSAENPQLQQEVKAYENFLSKGKFNLESHEVKYLRTDNFHSGGVFVPQIQVNEIIKNITEVSNLRPFARIKTMAAKAETMPVRIGTVTATMTGEGQPSVDTQPTYGDLQLIAKKMTATGYISYEAIQDSSVDLVAEMNIEVGEQFGKLEGSQFVNGSGAGNNIQGFMQHPDIDFINSGDASNITFNSIIKVAGEIKTGYNPVYAFNLRTLAVLRLLDYNKNYIFESGNLAGQIPSTICGRPYIILPDMPDIATGTFPIIFGDFKNFLIGERKALTVIRDESTLAETQLVRYVYHRRVGAVVMKPEAFKKIKISNS